LTGDKPPLNDWESFVIDHQHERLYSYGGVAPYDKTYTPTSDFHCLNLRSMEWENIGVGAFTALLGIVSPIYVVAFAPFPHA
jgi:hypothetical protein